MRGRQPIDNNGNAIPVLAFKEGKAHKITVSAVSAKNTTQFNGNTQVISLYATTDVYLAFGDNTIVATTSDHFFPANLYYDIAVPNGGYIAVLQVTSSGTLYISEKE